MSKVAGATAKKGKGAQRKGKGKGAADGTAGAETGLSVVAHPRARASVAQIKSWTGLVGFLLALALSLHASVPLADALERALIAGVTGYLVAWACAVIVWRALILAELRARVEQIVAARKPVTK